MADYLARSTVSSARVATKAGNSTMLKNASPCKTPTMIAIVASRVLCAPCPDRPATLPASPYSFIVHPIREFENLTSVTFHYLFRLKSEKFKPMPQAEALLRTAFSTLGISRTACTKPLSFFHRYRAAFASVFFACISSFYLL